MNIDFPSKVNEAPIRAVNFWVWGDGMCGWTRVLPESDNSAAHLLHCDTFHDNPLHASTQQHTAINIRSLSLLVYNNLCSFCVYNSFSFMHIRSAGSSVYDRCNEGLTHQSWTGWRCITSLTYSWKYFASAWKWIKPLKTQSFCMFFQEESAQVAPRGNDYRSGSSYFFCLWKVMGPWIRPVSRKNPLMFLWEQTNPPTTCFALYFTVVMLSFIQASMYFSSHSVFVLSLTKLSSIFYCNKSYSPFATAPV